MRQNIIVCTITKINKAPKKNALHAYIQVRVHAGGKHLSMPMVNALHMYVSQGTSIFIQPFPPCQALLTLLTIKMVHNGFYPVSQKLTGFFLSAKSLKLLFDALGNVPEVQVVVDS